MKKSKLKYTQISQIKELAEKNDLDRLAQMSCYAHANAFYKLASVDDSSLDCSFTLLMASWGSKNFSNRTERVLEKGGRTHTVVLKNLPEEEEAQ
jgi:hypothetical protein